MSKINDFEQGDCPACGESWQGEEIPEEWRDSYGSSTHYSRVFGIEYGYDNPEAWDGISEYMCPDCKARFNRWTKQQLADGEVAKLPMGGKT